LDVDLDVGDDAVVAVVGPNGAGKTTLVRALAGLVSLDRGRVVLDSAVVEDTAAGIRVPRDERNIGLVFQEHRLFPHLSALENVAFGLRASGGVSKDEARSAAAQTLGRVGRARAAAATPTNQA